MKILFAIGIAVSALLLTSCSNPNTSGGVTLSKDPHPSNALFLGGSCNGQHSFAETNTGCGWLTTADEKTYYIEPNATLKTTSLASENLTGANLTDATMTGANLRGVNLAGANLYRAWLQLNPADSSTICPNGKPWSIGGGGNCPF